MTAERFAEYQAHYELEPWGDDWQRTGVTAAAVYNANRARNGTPVKPEQFIPRQSPGQSQAQIGAAIAAFATMHNARSKK